MEEEVSFIERNLTGPADASYEMSTMKYIQEAFLCLICIVGIVCDSLIIYIIAKNRQMRSRTNIMIMNWAITDLLFLLSTPSLVSYALDFLGLIGVNRRFYCIVTHSDASYQFAGIMFIIVLLSNKLIETTKVSSNLIIWSIYGFVIIISIIHSVLCINAIDVPILYLLVSLIFLLAFAVMIIMEIMKCCKRKTDPMSEKKLMRFNFARIYVYIWFASVVFLFLGYPNLLPRVLSMIFQYIYLTALLTSMFQLIYLVNADKHYKICFLNIFRRAENKYNIDATISFAEESNKTGVENPGVNIQFDDSNNKIVNNV